MNDPLPRTGGGPVFTQLTPFKTPHEPIGGDGFRALIDAYADRGFVERLAGTKAFYVPGLAGLPEARACVLGLRQTGLPVYVSLKLDADGETENGGDPLAALICMQELGAGAFGLCGDADAAHGAAELLLPYAKIPLFGGDVSLRESLESGVNERPPRPEDSPLLLADESQVYYLEEDFTLSEPIDCELDIAEQVLTAEDEGYDALLFHIESLDGAENFAREGYMARRAACFLAESEELLDAVLLSYNGRAIIDSRSDMDEAAMEALARGYGAVIR